MKRTKAVVSRQIGKHRPGCRALLSHQRGEWFTPWACLVNGAPLVFGTTKGNIDRKVTRRNHMYLLFCCNDIECRAQLIVSNDAVLRMVEAKR